MRFAFSKRSLLSVTPESWTWLLTTRPRTQSWIVAGCSKISLSMKWGNPPFSSCETDILSVLMSISDGSLLDLMTWSGLPFSMMAISSSLR